MGPHGMRHHRHMGPRGGPPLAGLTVPALLLLLRDREMHGYALRDELESAGLVADVDFGNLYRTLRRLEAAGLVTSRWEQAGEGSGRRLYALTEDGRIYLDRAAEALSAWQSVLTRFLERYRQDGSASLRRDD
jgi:PadR family transcriptional regulator PadR